MISNKFNLLFLLTSLFYTGALLGADKKETTYALYLENNAKQSVQVTIIETSNLRYPANEHVYDIPSHMAKPLNISVKDFKKGHIHFAINNGTVVISVCNPQQAISQSLQEVMKLCQLSWASRLQDLSNLRTAQVN